MKRLLTISAISALTVALVGCSSTAPRLAETKLVNFPDAAVMPTPEEVKDPGLSVILTQTKGSNPQDIYIGQKAFQQMETLVQQAGNKLLERKLAASVADELGVHEWNGKFNTRGIEGADVAVLSEVIDSGITYSFKEERERENKDGETRVTPASCTHTATTSIAVKAYKMPSMSLIGSWEFSGKANNKTEMDDEDCPINTTTALSLLGNSAVAAVNTSIYQLLNPIAPNYYILERRDAEEGSVYRTSLGSTKGAKLDKKVNIYKIERIAATEYTEEQRNKIFLGTGVVTADIGPDFSYIYVEDEKVVDEIRRGDVVQIIHTKCGIGKDVGPLDFCW